jgi:hypothetical protein
MYVFCLGASVVPRPKGMTEGARFENPDAIETIGLDLVLSDRSQSLTEESEAGEKPIKPDGAR